MKRPATMTIRLGKLRQAVEARIAKTGETASEYIRRLIADDCGIDVPTMRGHWLNLKPFKKK